MPVNLLIPLDGSESAMRAVEYVAKAFGHNPDVDIMLLHILPGIPPSLWDDGHILDAEEHQQREELVHDWEDQQAKEWQVIFDQARNKLIQAGVGAEAIRSKFQPQYGDIAEDILDEAELEGRSTIVIGRRGLTGAAKFFLGSVSAKIVNHARGIAVIIVDYAPKEESLESRWVKIQERRLKKAKEKAKIQAKEKEKKKAKKKTKEKVKEKAKTKTKKGFWQRLIDFSKYGTWS
jgi:nucleotide-binding universal stress UspA family protein